MNINDNIIVKYNSKAVFLFSKLPFIYKVQYLAYPILESGFYWTPFFMLYKKINTYIKLLNGTTNNNTNDGSTNRRNS